MNRAYSLLHVKAIDSERRVITGIATTPEPDRLGDVIESKGVTFKNPLPLLLHHDKAKPVGRVTFSQPTATGVAFEASLPLIEEPGIVKDRVDEAWHSIKAGLIVGVSIGFRAYEAFVEPLKSGGLRFLKTEVFELSLVTIPANASATILTVKDLDLAASGRHTPGVTGTSTVVRLQKAAPPMTTPEQITQFENTRAAKAARMNELMTKAAETGSTLDAAQTEEYDTLKLEVKSVDEHLVRLHDQEQLNITTATRITSTTHSVTASDLRGGPVPVIQVKSMLPKGTAFTRFAMAMASGKGDSFAAMERAKTWHDSTPEVELMVKAAVAAGTTTDATWAGPLAVAQPLVNEFLELLRPRTLLGRIPGLRQVPFNISVPSQTAGGTYAWVGQGLAKPVTKPAYSTVSVPFAKAAGIIVMSEELVKLSTPSAEALVREEMIAGMGQFLDVQFNDPAVAVAANVSPASITNGASTAAASGVTGAAAKADLAASVAVFTAAGIPLEGSVWLMNDSNAFGLGLSINGLGQPLFPGVSIAGGTIMGMPVIVSNNVSTRVILVHAPSILFADEGGVRIDVSREASVQMDSAPDNPATSSTVLVSLWQNNLVGLRAERMITWIRARTAAVRYITAAAYIGTLMRLAIAAPTRDLVPAKFAVDLAELYAFTRQLGPFEDVTIHFVASSYIHEGQERVLEDVITQWHATHVLWLETDMAFPKDAAIRLAQHNRPIVGVNAVLRHFPIRFTAIKAGQRVATTAASSGLEEVDVCGLAVTLMRTDVVEGLDRPWFRHEWDPATQRDRGHDAVFCRRLREAGHRIYIDHDLSKEIGHIGYHTYRPLAREVALTAEW